MSTTSPPDWLERYLDGQRAEVWHELRQFGATIRDTGYADEAQRVCDEMARRARHNIETIVARLTAAGYRFHVNDDERSPAVPFAPPGQETDGVVRWLTETFDAVPMTLLSWARIVGDVWLVGTHPDWAESSEADPLVLEVTGSRYPGSSMAEYFAGELDVWREMTADEPGIGPFVLPLAPDRLHKANVSGGGPYGIVLPDGCVDGLFAGEATMPFVAYLNGVFEGGGFPHPTRDGNGWRVRRELADDLLPL